jgi:UDP-GlcNAc:undecaprenyl-phosphate GlcNAc-1-phosphate transferase
MGIGLLAAFVLLAAALLSSASVPATVGLARRLGAMDQPGERKVHANATPRLGGLAVFFSFMAVVGAGYLLSPRLTQIPFVRSRFGPTVAFLADVHLVDTKLLGLLLGSSLAFGIGLVDDLAKGRFPVQLKIFGQVVAAVILIAVDVRTSFMPYAWANIAVTLLWLVGVTNAFNLLDNMDGLSAGVACIACGVLLLNAWSLGEFFISLILAAFMGSLLGFLFFNFHPASVFLGDCGSLFIGYVMGSLTILERYVSHASGTLFPVLMPVVVLAVPLVDTATVITIRLRERRPIYVGDARHLSHRLLSLGFSQRATVLFIYLVTLCLGLGVVNLSDATLGQALIILLQSAVFVSLILILMFFGRQPA